jgi:hypothetical protein
MAPVGDFTDLGWASMPPRLRTQGSKMSIDTRQLLRDELIWLKDEPLRNLWESPRVQSDSPWVHGWASKASENNEPSRIQGKLPPFKVSLYSSKESLYDPRISVRNSWVNEWASIFPEWATRVSLYERESIQANTESPRLSLSHYDSRVSLHVTWVGLGSSRFRIAL